MNQNNFFAYALIIIGTVILLFQLNIFEPTRAQIVIAGSLLLGVILFRKGLIHPEKKGIFWGSFFILFGLSVFFILHDFLPTGDPFEVGLLLLIIAVANLISFSFNRKRLSNVTLALVFSGLSAGCMLVYFGFISSWTLAYMFSMYWPLLLIAGGLILLIEGLRRREHKY